MRHDLPLTTFGRATMATSLAVACAAAMSLPSPAMAAQDAIARQLTAASSVAVQASDASGTQISGGADFSSAVNVQVGERYVNTDGDSDFDYDYDSDYDYYRLELKEPGFLSADFSAVNGAQLYDGVTHEGLTSYYHSDYDYDYDYDDDSRALGTYVASGQYVIGMAGDYGKAYGFEIDFAEAGESFPDVQGGSNNSIAKASRIEIGGSYRGQIAANDTVDYFKLDLPTSGRLSLSTKSYFSANYKMLDSKGAQLWSGSTELERGRTSASGSFNFELTSGTYYLEVRGGEGNYTFKTSFADAGESFPESQGVNDNSLVKANHIETGSNYTGHLSLSDSADYFTFNTSESGIIRISTTSNMGKTDFAVYDKYGDLVSSKSSVKGGKEISWQVDCGVGQYYLAVSKNSKKDTGSYRFKVAELSDIGRAQVTGFYGAVYTGRECKPDFEVTYKGRLLTLNVDYTASFSNNVYAGDAAVVTISGIGDFTGTKKATFSIAKAEQPMEVEGQSSWVNYNYLVFEPISVEDDYVYTVTGSQGEVVFKKVGANKLGSNFKVESNGTVTVKKGTPKGKYKLKIEAKARGNSNYKSGSKTFTAKITVKGGIPPKRTLQNATNNAIRYFSYLDSTKTQAVAITAKSVDENMGWYEGSAASDVKVWLIAREKATVLTSSDRLSASSGSTKLYPVQNGQLFVVEYPYVSDSYSVAWFIRDGQATMLPKVGGGLTMGEENEFTAWHSAFDHYRGTGHTWKQYYYHWNGKGLVEYGGKAVTAAQLKRVKNGAKVLRAIEKQGKVGKIYYRSNGVINVNYSNGDFKKNVTLKYESGKVSYAKVNTWGKTAIERATDSGVYQKRNPDNVGRVVVSYPEKFPETGR